MCKWRHKLGIFWKTSQRGFWLPWERELLPAMQTGNARGDFTTTLCEAFASPRSPSKTYVLVQPQNVGYRLREIYVCMMQKVRKDYDNCPLSGHETSEWNSGPVRVMGKIAVDFTGARFHPVQVGGKQKSVPPSIQHWQQEQLYCQSH